MILSINLGSEGDVDVFNCFVEAVTYWRVVYSYKIFNVQVSKPIKTCLGTKCILRRLWVYIHVGVIKLIE